jgi:hypothetical protein
MLLREPKMEATPTASVWSVRLRGLGCCVSL